MSLQAEKPLPETDDVPFWRRKAMKDMTPAEWESLCDGCGRCCLNKLQEEGSDRTYYTDVGCKLLDGQSCRCTDYSNRSAKVKDCVTLTTRCAMCSAARTIVGAMVPSSVAFALTPYGFPPARATTSLVYPGGMM